MAVAMNRFCPVSTFRTRAVCVWRRAQQHQRCRGTDAPATRDDGRGAVKFDSPEVATAGKTAWEVFRGWMVFKLFTYDFPVDHSMKLYNFSRRLLGRWITSKLLRATAFGQFAGGTDEVDTAKTVERLAQRNISSIWNYSIEQDVGEGSPEIQSVSSVAKQEKEFQRINEIYLKSIEMSASCNCDRPIRFAAVKLTAIVDIYLLKKLSSMVTRLQDKFLSLATSSDNILERIVSVDHLLKEHPGKVPKDYFAGKRRVKSGLTIVDWMDHFGLLSLQPQLNSERSSAVLDSLPRLTDLELEQLNSFVKRIEAIGECASSEGVSVLVDAEQTYFQAAIHHLTMHHLVPRFNGQKAVIYNTIQTYLTTSFDTLMVDLASARHYAVKYGVKVVRGGYMDQERRVAASLGHPCLVHPDKPSTDGSYHKTLEHTLNEVAKGHASVMVASHNQKTVEFALEKIRELGLSLEDGSVTFGQLLGMGDYLTYPLAQAGYVANKVMPYGPIDAVASYLSRRAQENRGMVKNAQAERFLYARELRRRMWG